MKHTEWQSESLEASLAHVLRTYWGYDSFLPLQQEAMASVLAGRDSLVVLPTGGGKSLCFQAPAMCLPGLAVVVSPLISLMKDQVDALRACGVPAACVNSSISHDEKRRVADDVRSGELKLLYLAPERLVLDRTISFLRGVDLSFVAIDEAHCISEWGHDFRPEYRELRLLKQSLPGVAIHAYTATATEPVRDDIVRELALADPTVLVGSFDRPNLVYRVARRNDGRKQLREVIDRHRDESGIVYCISRAEVDRTCAWLVDQGYRALPYHAGMGDDERRRNQEAFIEERVETIVATVAFGMGIDKSNVRYVVHLGMPKSLENYQQESGRAGRDRLEAECCLYFSGRDFGLWRSMLDELPESAREGAIRSLGAMYEFANGVVCRHRTLVGYFGQSLVEESCGACDVCLGELATADGALEIGQKIVSCVARLEQRFGGDYTSKVLSGSRDQRILENGHDRLSTWGILADDANQRTIRDWIEQLVSQQFLEKVGEYNVLQLTAKGTELLRGNDAPRLLKPREASSRREAGEKGSSRRSGGKADPESWSGVDRGLFEVLRQLRRDKASERGVPPYMVFGDAALRDMARQRPSTLAEFLDVKGVGEKKCADFGKDFVACVNEYGRGEASSGDYEVVVDSDADAATDADLDVYDYGDG